MAGGSPREGEWLGGVVSRIREWLANCVGNRSCSRYGVNCLGYESRRGDVDGGSGIDGLGV